VQKSRESSSHPHRNASCRIGIRKSQSTGHVILRAIGSICFQDRSTFST